jgi:hypothetical protein
MVSGLMLLWSVLPLSGQGLPYIGIHTVGEFWNYLVTSTDSSILQQISTGQILYAQGLTFSVADESTRVVQAQTVGNEVLFTVEAQSAAFMNPSVRIRDTLVFWDVQDTVFQDTSFPQMVFITPFTIGAGWRQIPSIPIRLGVPVDVDNDGDMDTLYIEDDSVHVYGQETVSTPVRSFFSWHLQIFRYYHLRYSHDTIPNDLDSTVWHEEVHTWIVPDTGVVKDSMLLEISHYGVHDTLQILKRWPYVRLLQGATLVQEQLRANQPSTFPLNVRTMSGTLLLAPRTDKGTPVRVSDLLGRTHFAGTLSHNRTLHLPPGVYVIQTPKARRSVVVP